jgi:hypothetical protein
VDVFDVFVFSDNSFSKFKGEEDMMKTMKLDRINRSISGPCVDGKEK